MQLRTWKRNPRLKADLDQLLADPDRCFETELWFAAQSDIFGDLALVVVWPGNKRRGALEASAMDALTEYLTSLESTFRQGGVKRVVLVMQSAGADVNNPFESLGEINRLLETLSHLSRRYRLEITGVLLDPLGTYGGASLFLSSVCDSLWCSEPSQLKLTGHAHQTP